MRNVLPSISRAGRLAAALPVMLLSLSSGGVALAQPSDTQSCTARKIVAMGRCYNCLAKEDRRLVLGGEADVQRCHDKLVDAFSTIDAGGGCGLTGDAEVAYTRVASVESDLDDTFLAEHFAAPDPAACAANQLKLAGRLAKCRAILRAGEVKLSRLYNDYSDHYNYDDYEPCMNVFIDRLNRIWEDGVTCPFPGDDGRNEVVSSIHFTMGYLPAGDFRDAHIGRAKLMFGALAGGDFSNATFSNTILDDADLAGSTFAGATFPIDPVYAVSMNRANLAGADFSGASIASVTAGALVACPAALPADWVCVGNQLLGPHVVADGYDLSGYDLEGVKLAGARFDGSDFSGANLRGIDFGDGQFGYSDFSGADLTNAVLGSMEIDGVNLDGADLSGVNLSYFDHSGIHFSARNLAACPAVLSSNYRCTQGTILGAWAIVDGLDFSGEDFTGGSYHHASFGGTMLVGTNFTSTQLSNANFTGANLTGANLANAYLYDATWSATICPDGVLSDAAGGTCCGHHLGSPPSHCE